MTEERRRRSGCLWAVVALQFVAIVMLVLIVAGVSALSLPGSCRHESKAMGVDDFPDFVETWSTGHGDAKVVRIELYGPLFLGEGRGFFGALSGADLVLASVKRATHDPEVRAIILDIDSPGGGITASDILHDALLEFRASGEGRVVVAVLGDTAASGGYYVAAAADCIVARPTTVTGSIGVILQTVNVQELAQKLGIHDVTIRSGRNKDLLNPLRPVNERQVELLQDVVDAMHARFVKIVAHGRTLSEESVRSLADGRLFTAEQALSAGLVDFVGHWRRGLEMTADLLGEEDVYVVRYEEAFSLSRLLSARSGWDPLRTLSRVGPRVRWLYQMQP